MTETELLSLLRQRIDVQRLDHGIVAGIVDAEGTRFIAYGGAANGVPAIHEDTVFQIGSVTKVFTSLLLLRLVQQGSISLQSEVQEFFDSTVLKIPCRNGRTIRLVDLSTHTSGLPRIPTNMSPASLENPYADYTFSQLASFLSTYILPREIGSGFEYSNTGGGLLGLALGQAMNARFETALQEQVLAPLRLTSTGFHLSDHMQSRFSPGHTAQLSPQAPWDFGILQGAGGLFSSARDLLRVLREGLLENGSWIASLMLSGRETTRPTSNPNLRAGLGWMLTDSDHKTIVWHNGATGGYRAFIGYRPHTRKGIVLLSNTSSQGLDTLGMQFLRS